MAKKNQLTASDHLPYAEFERLLDCLHNDEQYRWEMYARLSFATACRASDVLQFRWGEILNVPFVNVTEKKTKKTRKVPMNPSVQKKFKELYNLLGRPDLRERIFPSYKDDQPFTIQYVNQRLKTFKHKYHIAIDNFSTHTFRKTFGRYVYEKSGRSAESLILLNKILNHASLQITKTYIGITQEEVDSVYNSICF